jgi:hypothetical protein
MDETRRYTVREGAYDGPVVDADYEHDGPDEPKKATQLTVAGETWMVVDFVEAASPSAEHNTLVVERAVGH